MPQGLVILGTRLLAEEVFDLITDLPGYEVAAFVENHDRAMVGKEIEGRPVLWIDDAVRLAKTHLATCALSTTQRKSYVEQAAALGFRFATLIHPTARVSSRATLGEGTFVSALSTIATRTTLGKSVFVNRSASIGHHTTIGDYCTIQPGAVVAGAITMGPQTYVGMRAAVLERKKIGTGCLIAAGAVVTEDLPDHVQVMGIPAKITKTGIEPK
jgi:sugar O-acyltransferase (sialic acid O-acetyltransferase NeuD family)